MKYYKQINVFQEKQTPNDLVDQQPIEQQIRWISILEQSNLKESTINALINNLKK